MTRIGLVLTISLYSLAWLAMNAEAMPLACPVVYAECVPRDECLPRDVALELAGAEPWESSALVVIGGGSIGKHPFDVLPTNYGADIGIVHRRVRFGSEILGTGYYAEGPAWRDVALALLYRDYAQGFAWQLAEWRRIVRPATSAGRRGGCRGVCLTVVAAIANSSPTLAVELGRATRWSPRQMLESYATTPHRTRRAALLGNLL